MELRVTLTQQEFDDYKLKDLGCKIYPNRDGKLRIYLSNNDYIQNFFDKLAEHYDEHPE